MTLIVAIPADHGVVFGSDSQVTAGAVRATGTTKIFPLNERGLWGASGELAPIQRVAERVATLPQPGQPLTVLRDTLARFVNESVTSLLDLDFRTKFFLQNPAALLSLHPADFLFVECCDEPRILHITVNGTPEWIEGGRFSATGNGDVFAHALLSKYAGRVLPLEKAQLLAYKVIEEAIQVGAYGLGPPIDIWTISAAGVQRATDEERTGLEDAARVLREAEVAMLAGDSPADRTPAS